MIFKWLGENPPINWSPTSGNVYETQDGAIEIPEDNGADIEEAKTAGLFTVTEADRLGGSSGMVDTGETV